VSPKSLKDAKAFCWLEVFSRADDKYI